jgi:hypothetical protein
VERIGMSLVATLSISLAAASALAQLPPAGPPTAQGTSRAWGELTFFTDSEETISVTSVCLLGEMRYFVSPDVAIEVRWPVLNHGSFESDFGGDSSSVKVGNAFGGAFWHGGDGRLTYRVGGGATLPLAWIDDDDGLEGFFALALASATHASLDLWLWLPETLSMVGSGGIEYVEGVVAGGEMDLALVLDIGDVLEDTEPVIQVRGWIGADLGEGSRAGVALGLVAVFDGDEEGDNAQLSLEPFVEIAFGNGFVLARLMMNLDEPNGFAFDEGGVWGLTVGGGGRW